MRNIQNFDSAIKNIVERIKNSLENLPEGIKASTYEIRLRVNRPVSLVGEYGTAFITADGKISIDKINTSCIISSFTDIKDTFDRICSYSIHTFQRSINNGYIPMRGGSRAGICGTAVCENGKITNVKDISGINIRIAKQVLGCCKEILDIFDGGSLILAGAPNSGKTTILRDLIRCLANGETGKFYKVSVIDERKEIASVIDGAPMNDIGYTSDILDSYPKNQAIDIAVRTLSPEIIACDEVMTDDEIRAIKSGVNCGSKFIVTVHADSEDEIFSRKQIEELLSTYSFRKLVLLDSRNMGKIKKVFDAGELNYEISLRRIGCNNVCFDRHKISTQAH